ncbi:EF-hand calcium-binding domain-containing protein 4B [Thalassophryne amazonica]|uniref:EF-hand calcium-binding domain-containing protein 4B n=1 Tax=Thalassophryne amazonica TaxID=390379 RepID=UPI001471C548|nr:EF-hand calcium-binding domain-containing protein 4B [Thalassophryne amazonica]
MAAFSPTCTPTSTGAQPAQHSHGGSEYVDGCDRNEQKIENRDLGRNTISEKTHEFFQMCDIDGKGFVTRCDMQRLNGELPLSAEELENVFDTLDSDSNGYLTLEEFSSGLTTFLSGQKISAEEGAGEKTFNKGPSEVLYQTQVEENPVPLEDDEEKYFRMLMQSLGATRLFEDSGEVRSLWAQLRRDEPHILANFEDFLARVASQIIEANQEKTEMESALKRKAATHDDEIKCLYEEMEQQITNEKDKIVLQDVERFQSRSQDLELQLSGKEKELDQLFQKQKRLEHQCQELHSEQHVTKVENVKLKHTNEELARELEHMSQELMLAQEQLSLLQEHSTRLHEEKEMEIYKLTEGLQRERASLLKQLDLLREMNKHLRDEKDMCFQKAKNPVMPLRKQRPLTSIAKHTNKNIFKSEDDDDLTSSGRQSLYRPSGTEETMDSRVSLHEGQLQRIISIEEDHLPHLLHKDFQDKSILKECSEGEEAFEEESADFVMSSTDHCTSSPQEHQSVRNLEEMNTPTSPRGQPVGKETSINEEGASHPPERLFKIILVGNSSVGKTSFLRQFCDNCFNSGTSATVGIDYSVKTITMDGSQVALQIWDTAGQERYRSITKQFFRKADGVVVMYDVTAEQSFVAVRQWLTSVKESAGEEIPIMLMANKTDRQAERQVQRASGEKLSKNYSLIFYECSAYSGQNVSESMLHLARILKQQEDREKEMTIQLSSPLEKKKSCC